MRHWHCVWMGHGSLDQQAVDALIKKIDLSTYGKVVSSKIVPTQPTWVTSDSEEKAVLTIGQAQQWPSGNFLLVETEDGWIADKHGNPDWSKPDEEYPHCKSCGRIIVDDANHCMNKDCQCYLKAGDTVA